MFASFQIVVTLQFSIYLLKKIHVYTHICIYLLHKLKQEESSHRIYNLQGLDFLYSYCIYLETKGKDEFTQEETEYKDLKAISHFISHIYLEYDTF